jgi:hypothetical protein
MSSVGILLPIRLLKSPHIIVISCGLAALSTSSTNYVAIFSYIFRFLSDVYGGMYILITLIRVLFGNIIYSNMPYSLLYYVSIYNGLRIYIASPPRVLPARRDSTSVKPSRVGGAAPSAIHVSYRHIMSNSSYSSTSSNFI